MPRCVPPPRVWPWVAAAIVTGLLFVAMILLQSARHEVRIVRTSTDTALCIARLEVRRELAQQALDDARARSDYDAEQIAGLAVADAFADLARLDELCA